MMVNSRTNTLWAVEKNKFKNEEDIRHAFVQFLASRHKTFKKNGIYKLPSCWHEVMNNDGNYIYTKSVKMYFFVPF